MLKKVALVVVLLAAGVGIAMYMRVHPADTAPAIAFQPQTGATAEVRIADLERALAAQIDRSRILEARIVGLEDRLRSAGAAAAAQPAAGGRPIAERFAQVRDPLRGEGPPDVAALRERQRERQLQRLVDAGFSRDRAEWIERRTEELEYQALQAQYDAQRSGRSGQAGFDVQRTLRSELGDVDYERYLRGTGRPTEVQVLDVLASSAAERSGLQPGDQVVSYAGTRVFDIRDINALTREGNPGETVIMEVRRNGQTVQVQVPRGVLGMTGGALRAPRGGGPRGGR